MTPKGRLKYPRLAEPDTKFDADGEYKTALIVSKEAAQSFITKLTTIIEKAVDSWKKENPKHKGKPINFPWEDELDDNGDETGNVEFKFKTKAVGRSKKSGETWSNKPAILDSSGKEVSGVNPWGGTVAKVGIEVSDFVFNNPSGVGVSPRLKLVQIIELVEGGSNAAAGFDIEAEDGFTGDDTTSDNYEDPDDDFADEEDEF